MADDTFCMSMSFISDDQSPFIVGKSALFLCLCLLSRGLSKNKKKKRKEAKNKSADLGAFYYFLLFAFFGFCFFSKRGPLLSFWEERVEGRQKRYR